MKEMTKKQHLIKLLAHTKYYNEMAPFPPYDTEWVKDIENKIKEMENNDKIDYDEEPVVACRYCKNLYIVTDEDMNDHCWRCGSINELTEFKNIHEYNEFVNGRNT